MLGFALSPARRTLRSRIAAGLTIIVVASGLSLAAPLAASASTPVGVPNSAACGQAGSVRANLVNVPDQVECRYTNRSSDGHGGAPDTFTVPDNTHVLTIRLNASYSGGLTTAQLAVTPGQVLQVNVGGRGEFGSFNGTSLGRRANGGWNGGGAGGTDGFGCTINRCGDGGNGALDVRTGNFGLSDRVLVAGGAGGAATDYTSIGGAAVGIGGGANGADGYTEACSSCVASYDGKGGGGSQQAGGYGGGNASGGGFGTGGQGGDAVPTIGAQAIGGHGGGGGYYGGGGGSGRVYGFCCLVYLAGSGGGGSGYAGAGTSNAVLKAGGGIGDQSEIVIRSIPDSFATKTTVSSNTNPSVKGEAVTFTAVVTTADPSTIPLGGGLVQLAYSTPGITSRLNVPVVISPGTPGRGVATITLPADQPGQPLSNVGQAQYFANYLGYSQDSDTGTYTVLPSGSPTLTQTVRRANTPQAITFPALTGLTQGGQYVDPGATASSGLPVTYSTTTPAVCGIDQGRVYVTAAGTCSVQANQPGNDTYLAAPQIERSIVIPKLPSTVEFLQTPYGVRPGATSGLYGVRPSPPTFTVQVTSATPAVCSVDDPGSRPGPVTSTFQALSGGTCTLVASIPGDANYEPSQTSTSFTIAALPKTDQTITFRTPSNVALGGQSLTLDAFSTSGLPISYSDYTPEVCTTDSAGTLTTRVAGTCIVQADQPGNLQYNRASSVRVSFTVEKTPQTLTITSFPEFPQVLGQYYPTGTSTSGLRLTFDASGACTITSNGLVNLTSGGTCTVTANQPGDERYAAAPPQQQSFTVILRTQKIVVTAPVNPVTGQDVTLRASQQGDSSSPVTFALVDIQAGGCSLDGETLYFIRSGPCIILADQAGDTYYSAAPQFMLVFQVEIGPQSIALGNAPTTATVGERYTPVFIETGLTDRTYGLNLTANPTSVCRNANPVFGVPYDYGVEFTAPGVCTITVQKYGDYYRYLDSPIASYEVTVGKPGQTVAFADPAPTGKTVGDTYTPLITPGPSLIVPILGTTSDASVCTVSFGKATFTGAGTCTLTLNQPGDATYADAPQVTRDIAVSLPVGTVAFGGDAPTDAQVGGSTTPVIVAGPSSATPVLDASGACSLGSNGLVTYTSAGTCSLTLNQPGDAIYAAAPQATRSFTVAKGSQVVAFTSAAPSATVGGATYTPTLTGGASTSPVVLTTTTSAVCSVSGGTVSFTGAGTCTLTADQAGDANYTAATTATQSLTVSAAPRKAQTITFTSTPPASPATGVAYAVQATATSGLTVTFGVKGSCSVTSTGTGTATVKLTGTTTPCTVTASQAGDATWLAATPITQVLKVAAAGRADLKVTATPASGTVPGGPLTMTVTVTNVGTRDSGLTTTQLVSSAPVTDAGGAVRSGKAAGPVTLTWKTPSVAVGQTITYTVVIAPRAKLTVTTTKTSTALADPTPLNNLVLGLYRSN